MLQLLITLFKQLPFADIVQTLTKKVANIKTVYPVGKKPLIVTGAWPKYTDGSKHVGVDFACKYGDPFKAICDGEVVWIKTGKKGKPGASTVKIKPDNDNIFMYHKHGKPIVKKGDRVKQDMTISHADDSGRSTGPHIHFEVRDFEGKDINPLLILFKYQPRLVYRIMQGKWNKKVRAVFEKYNKPGLEIIEGKS